MSEFTLELAGRKIKPHVIVLTEVWIYSHEISLYSLDGYTSYGTCQDNYAAGGVIIFTKNDLGSVEIYRHKTDVEACVVEIRAGETRFCIIGAYRSPSLHISNPVRFVDDALECILTKVGPTRNTLYFADANINIRGSGGVVEDYLNKMASHGLEWISTEPTRLTQNSMSTIDHIFVRESGNYDLRARVLDSNQISDHKILHLSLTFIETVVEENPEAPRQKTDWSRFSSELAKISVPDYFEIECPDRLMEKLISDIEECRKLSSGNIKSPSRNNTPLKPWITTGILRSMRVKYRLWKECQKAPGNAIIRNRFCRYRNIYRQMLRTAENNYLKRRIRLSGDLKETWRVINEQLRGKRCTRHLPKSLSNTSQSKHELNRANSFYANTGTRVVTCNNLFKSTNHLPSYKCKSTLREFQTPSIEEIILKIKKLKNGKAPGRDGILANTLKKNLDFFAPVLQHLIACILKSGQFPRELKNATTILIYKKGDPDKLENYRPISLLSVFSKVVERVLAEAIEKHLESNQIISDCQFGYRKNKGTQDAILCVQKTVSEAFEAGRVPVVTMLDFSSAFDCVNHDRLLENIKCAGIASKALDLLKSYLSKRTQSLRDSKGENSDPTTISCGVPQGGSLSALFFSLFINDLLKPDSESFQYIAYADDVSLIASFRENIDWS